MRQGVINSFTWEKLRTNVRTLVLVSLFSLLSTGHTKNTSIHTTTNTSSIEQKSFLDDVPILDKSLLYYYFAKNPEGEQTINEQCFAITHDFWPLIEQIACKYDIDPLLVGAIILLESWGDPKAHSVAGARWLMQMLRSTAADYGGYFWKDGKLIDKRTDPEWSIDAWCKHLSRLYEKFDSRSLAVAAYHMGEGNMGKKLQKMYLESTGMELVDMESLYTIIPSDDIISFFAKLDDKSFDYYAKVRNAQTVLEMYVEDCALFDIYVDMYADLDYDLRWIVAENVVFSHEPISNDAAIQDALIATSMCLIDHNFLCKTGETENAFHPSVQDVITLIDSLVQFPFTLSYWTISDEYYNNLDSLTQVDKRHHTHRTGYVFDIFSANLSLQQRNKMMYILTVLRYQWVLLWCREFRDTDHEQYHVAVLPDAWKNIVNAYSTFDLSFSDSLWEK